VDILVTGGAGYLGSTLVGLLLQAGQRVRVLDALLHGGESMLGAWHHPCFEFVYGDIRDRQKVRAALNDMEIVVHLAAIVGDPACARNPNDANEVNLSSSLMLLDECRRQGVRHLIFASTCSNYGKMPEEKEYVDENSRLAPLSVYAETKVQFERALLDGNMGESLCPTLLRLATLYGVSTRMRFDLTVNEFTLDMITKKHLVVYGEQFWRPYVHVRDAARAICEVLSAPAAKVRGQIYNVGATSQNFRKSEIVELVRVHAPDARIEYVKKADDPRSYRVSFEKIASQLNFRITRTVEDGIAEVAHMLRSNVMQSFDDPRLRN
jgi:nucleoside-diphosphate-sugar epimerase